jgi:hypothetical protein
MVIKNTDRDAMLKFDFSASLPQRKAPPATGGARFTLSPIAVDRRHILKTIVPGASFQAATVRQSRQSRSLLTEKARRAAV